MSSSAMQGGHNKLANKPRKFILDVSVVVVTIVIKFNAAKVIIK